MYFALLSFFIYFAQLTRDIYSGDTGDLVASACVGGVPHPPGYPLFTLLGHTLCSLPLPLPPVTKVAIVSAAAGAAAVYILYRFSLRITKSRYLSVLASSILAFSYLFWFHAEVPEVFGFHNLFVALLLYLAYDYHERPSAQKLYRLAAFTGLALTHHQTTLFLGPSLAILVLSRFKELWHEKKSVTVAIAFAAAGFVLPYIYVFIASSFNPLVNWGSVVTPNDVVHLIQRKAYGGFAPSVDNGIPIAVKTTIVRDYFRMLLENYSYQGLALAVLGVIYLGWKKQYILLIAFFGAWLMMGPVFVAYAATYYTTSTAFGIIERFYSMSFTVFAFFLPCGLMFLNEILKRWLPKQPLRFLLISYFLIIPIFMIIYNRPKTDMSKTQIGNTLAFDILDNLPQNAVLFVSNDTTVFNVWYAQYVLHRRPDVDIINPPGVGSNDFLDNTLTEFHKKNPKLAVKSLMQPALNDIAARRPMYSTYDIPERPTDSVLVPYGLVYKMTPKGDIPDKETYIMHATDAIRNLHRTRLQTLTPAEQNLVATEIPLIYSLGHVRIGDFLDSYYKDPQAAESFYRLALWRNEENSAAYAGLALSLFKGYKDCTSALYNIDQAIKIYPVWSTFYVQRYIMAKQCNVPAAKLRSYKQDYTRRFNKDLDIILKDQYKLNL